MSPRGFRSWIAANSAIDQLIYSRSEVLSKLKVSSWRQIRSKASTEFAGTPALDRKDMC